MQSAKQALKRFLRWTERYFRTDMVYIARGSFWVYVQRIGLTVTTFATFAAFANFLPQQVYGEYKFILSIVGILGILTLPGMTTAVTRSVARGRDAILQTAFRTRLKWSVLSMIALLGVSGWYLFQGNMVLAVAFAAAAPLGPLRSALTLYGPFWQGKKRFDKQALYQLILGGGVAVHLVIVLYLTDSLLAIVITVLGTQTVLSLLLYLSTLRHRENSIEDAEAISFGKHLTMTGLLGQLANNLDKILLWEFLGPVQLALYTFSLEPANKLRGFVPLKELALPKLSEHGVGTLKRKKSVLRKILLSFGISLPAAAALALAAPFFYGFLFPQYTDSVPYFQALTLLMALLPLNIFGSALVAEKKTKYLYIKNFTVPSVKIVLFLALIAPFGVWGVVGAVLITEVVKGALGGFFFWRM